MNCRKHLRAVSRNNGPRATTWLKDARLPRTLVLGVRPRVRNINRCPGSMRGYSGDRRTGPFAGRFRLIAAEGVDVKSAQTTAGHADARVLLGIYAQAPPKPTARPPN